MSPVRFVGSLFLALVVTVLPPCAFQAQESDGIHFGAPTAIGSDEALGLVIDAALAPDGSVTVIDYTQAAVFRYGPDGHLQWRMGRRGGGPGEFRNPYRVGISADGGALVFDLSGGGITRISADGHYVGVSHLDIPFQVVDGLMSLSDGGLVVAGVSSSDGAIGHSLHVFDSTYRHLRSFGPLPEVRDRLVLRYWGAGVLTRSKSGDLLFVRRLPYEVYRYTVDGGFVQRFAAPFEIEEMPDDAYRLSRSGSRMQIETGLDVVRPTGVIELSDGRLLAGRVSHAGGCWDLFSARGELLATRASPSGWLSRIGFDGSRGILWVVGEVDDEVVLLRVPLVLDKNDRSP